MFTTSLQQHSLIHWYTKASHSSLFMPNWSDFNFCFIVCFHLSLIWDTPFLNTSVVFVVTTESGQHYWQWCVLGSLGVGESLLEQRRSLGFVFFFFLDDPNLRILRYRLAAERSPIRLYCLHITHAHPACAPTAAADQHSRCQTGAAPLGLFLSMPLTTNHFYHGTLISSCCTGDQ